MESIVASMLCLLAYAVLNRAYFFFAGRGIEIQALRAGYSGRYDPGLRFRERAIRFAIVDLPFGLSAWAYSGGYVPLYGLSIVACCRIIQWRFHVHFERGTFLTSLQLSQIALIELIPVPATVSMLVLPVLWKVSLIG